MRLNGKIGIVTGAAKGMGGAISRALARDGADLMLAARERAPLEDLAEELRAGGRRAEVVATDVTDEAAVKAMVERTLAVFGGRIDILVNVAGVTGPIETPVWEIERDDYLAVLTGNVLGTFLPIKYVMATMVAQRSGRIVNIAGSSGIRGYRYRTAYSSSKWPSRVRDRSWPPTFRS